MGSIFATDPGAVAAVTLHLATFAGAALALAILAGLGLAARLAR